MKAALIASFIAAALALVVMVAPAHKNEGQCPFGLCVQHSSAGLTHGHE